MKESRNDLQYVWWKKLVAIVASINLLLVAFNLSYLSLRDVYLQQLPSVVSFYDSVKGIEPHPDTETYLQTVEDLQQAIATKGLTANPTKKLLDSLRQQSIALIEENPFLTANKLATFAKLKHRIEYRLQTRSAKEAFTSFWSLKYLLEKKVEAELDFFQQNIAPLLKTNYYRRSDANGLYIDNFWRIDLGFVIFFVVEYLSRTFIIARKRSDLNWWDAMLRRWYDTFMFFPVWRWLRIIPVTVRVHKSGLVNMERVLAQITHEPAAYISHRASMFLMVRLLNQSQEAINDGAIANILTSSTSDTFNATEEKVNVIIDRLVGLAICDVLPRVQPDVEALLRHVLRGALKESDIYQAMRSLPGIANLPQDAIEQLADYLAQGAYQVLIDSYTDSNGRIIFDRLKNNFSKTLKQQLQNKATQSEIQALVMDLLEDWKASYVLNSHQRNAVETLAETEKIMVENQQS